MQKYNLHHLLDPSDQDKQAIAKTFSIQADKPFFSSQNSTLLKHFPASYISAKSPNHSKLCQCQIPNKTIFFFP